MRSIKLLNNMEITELPQSYDELINLLKREGSISFLINRKHKKRFYNCTQRLNKLETLFGKNKVWAQIYGLYVGVLQILLTLNHKNLDNAVTAYQLAWRHIETIQGQDAEGKKTKVTFNART